MKTSNLLAAPSEAEVTAAPTVERDPGPTIWTAPLPHIVAGQGVPGESVRHILLGPAEAVRQTIHLLHSLHYAETVLWSPVMTVAEPLVIAPASGEAMSLLRKRV